MIFFPGTVHLFSGMHSSGERLAQISGVAAVLRFPLPDLDLVVAEEEAHLAAAGAGEGGGRFHGVLEMGRGAQGESWELGEEESSSTSGASEGEGGWSDGDEADADDAGLLERVVAGQGVR